jgi:hypothetical protein
VNAVDSRSYLLRRRRGAKPLWASTNAAIPTAPAQADPIWPRLSARRLSTRTTLAAASSSLRRQRQAKNSPLQVPEKTPPLAGSFYRGCATLVSKDGASLRFNHRKSGSR